MTPLNFIELILNAYQHMPGTMEIGIGNAHSGLMFNTVMRVNLQQLRDMHFAEVQRQKKNEFIEEKKNIPNTEVQESPEGIIVRGKPLSEFKDWG